MRGASGATYSGRDGASEGWVVLRRGWAEGGWDWESIERRSGVALILVSGVVEVELRCRFTQTVV